jgi:glycosyltransferase involved in cell wall biosynthesis
MPHASLPPCREGSAVAESANANSPKVSVVSITYNHEAYIRDALEGFIAQKTGFPVEVIVADDASTDATPAIVQDYASRYPHLFRPILRSENVGIHANLTGALSAARGEYLALCEGDDYWTYPLKLAKQVAYLDRHPKTAVCFHPVRIIWEDGRKDSKFPPVYTRGNLSVETLILMNFIQTNSVVYRRLPRYDDIPADIMPLDWYLNVRHAAYGDVAMLPETMAVYRRHSQGVWYDWVANRAKFWLTQGPGEAAMYDAMLDLFQGNPQREGIVAWMADFVLGKIAKDSGPEGRAVFEHTVAQHPRIAMVALQHRWTPMQRITTLWRALGAVAPSRKGLADVWPSRLDLQTGRTNPD